MLLQLSTYKGFSMLYLCISALSAVLLRGWSPDVIDFLVEFPQLLKSQDLFSRYHMQKPLIYPWLLYCFSIHFHSILFCVGILLALLTAVIFWRQKRSGKVSFSRSTTAEYRTKTDAPVRMGLIILLFMSLWKIFPLSSLAIPSFFFFSFSNFFK